MLLAPPHRVPRPRRPRAGVTLVEVVIAIFVLTVGVLSIVSLFPTGYTLGQHALDRSVAALAARDAHARILAESRRSSFSFPTGSSFAQVPEPDRVGTISDVDPQKLTCKVRGVTPSWGDGVSGAGEVDDVSLAGYYCAITSGAAAGGVYRISSSSGDTLTFASSGGHKVTFLAGSSATAGEPVRVGDHFAIIGASGGRRCFPSNFLSGSSNRTIEIAAQGDLDKTPKDYSYGCILSPSYNPPDGRDDSLCRVDIFVYRNFQPAGEIEQQDRPVGHFVTYITGRFDDYAP